MIGMIIISNLLTLKNDGRDDWISIELKHTVDVRIPKQPPEDVSNPVNNGI